MELKKKENDNWQKQIVDSFESIKTADLKVCLMHHPLDWLVDVDKLAIEKCINEFDIILNGHIHESKTKIYTSYNGQCVFNTCGNLIILVISIMAILFFH